MGDQSEGGTEDEPQIDVPDSDGVNEAAQVGVEAGQELQKDGSPHADVVEAAGIAAASAASRLPQESVAVAAVAAAKESQATKAEQFEAALNAAKGAASVSDDEGKAPKVAAAAVAKVNQVASPETSEKDNEQREEEGKELIEKVRERYLDMMRENHALKIRNAELEMKAPLGPCFSQAEAEKHSKQLRAKDPDQAQQVLKKFFKKHGVEWRLTIFNYDGKELSAVWGDVPPEEYPLRIAMTKIHGADTREFIFENSAEGDATLKKFFTENGASWRLEVIDKVGTQLDTLWGLPSAAAFPVRVLLQKTTDSGKELCEPAGVNLMEDDCDKIGCCIFKGETCRSAVGSGPCGVGTKKCKDCVAAFVGNDGCHELAQGASVSILPAVCAHCKDDALEECEMTATTVSASDSDSDYSSETSSAAGSQVVEETDSSAAENSGATSSSADDKTEDKKDDDKKDDGCKKCLKKFKKDGGCEADASREELVEILMGPDTKCNHCSKGVKDYCS